MGQLDSAVDPTGTMSQIDINQSNLSQIIDEMNRNSDQLDAIANSLNIINKGTVTGSWDGVATHGVSLQAAHGFGSAPIFLAFYNRSDNPTQWLSIPQWTYDTSGNFQSRTYAYTDATNINLNFISVINGSVASFIFSYYILQQPAQVPVGS